MSSTWARFVAWTGREQDARPLWLVRVLVPLVLLGDLLDMAWRGATDAVLYPAAFGGIEGRTSDWALLQDQPWGGPLWFGLLLVALPLASAGLAARPAIAVALVAHAQLGHLFNGGDRGIDRILRTVLLIVLFSPVSARRVPARIASWPSDLIRWLLMLVYLDAGVVKARVLGQWLSLSEPELYTILADPLAGRLDPVFWESIELPFFLGGVATVVVELAAPLILTRFAPYWAVFGVCIHVGIALTMDLGMFPYGMLALYPLLAPTWVTAAWDRAQQHARPA